MTYIIIGTNRYYKIVNHGELQAIIECSVTPDTIEPLVSKFNRGGGRISDQIGTHHWSWDDISQAEFETYQAFGIKEIKL